MKTTLPVLVVSLMACAAGGKSADLVPPPANLARQPEGPQAADLILRNGAIYTVDDSQPWAEAVAVRDGEIVFVGADAEVTPFQGPRTRVVDLEGRMAMPGIHDSHVHLLEANHEAGGTCILPNFFDPEDAVAIVQACAPNQVGTDWVLGFGHSILDLLYHLDQGGRPPKEILDQAVPDRPVAIIEETSHSVWANSLALAAAGFTASSPDPPGGAILRDRVTGEPNGILLDGAGEIVMDLALVPNPVLARLNDEALSAGLLSLRSFGITSIADARAYWRRGYVEAWQRAEQAGELSVRAVVGLWAYPYLDDTDQIAALGAMYSADPSSRLRFSQVKIYTDGEITHTTAALLQPYLLPGLVGPLGLDYFDPTRLTRYITELERFGFDMHIHTIGDRGVHQALNAIDAAGAANCGVPPVPGVNCADRRHRLTHIELVQPSDVARFAAQGTIADLQMSSVYVEPQHLFDNVASLGAVRITERLWQLRSLWDARATVVLSSDYDVGDLSPFMGMQRSLTRGAQSLPSVEAAIRAYTLNAAHLMRQEDRVGSITVGKRADILVLDQNLFNIGLSQIGATKVLNTFLDGEQIWPEAPALFEDGFESGSTVAWDSVVP